MTNRAVRPRSEDKSSNEPVTAALGRGDRRREAILDAATAEFLARGYEGASLRSIIRAGGGSSETLYRQFGNKEGLFRAIVERRMEQGFMRSIAISDSDQPLEQELSAFGLSYLQEFTAPDSLSFFRMMVGEATLIPETTRQLWEVGPHAAIARLRSYFERKKKQGVIDVDDCGLAAAQFMDMIKAGLHLRMLLVGTPATMEEIEASVRQGVAIFCRGVCRSA